MASRRRLREAEKKSNRGNTGREFRARYASIRRGVEQAHAGLCVPLDPVALLAELEAMYPDV